MRVATWNLERPNPRSWKRAPRQRARLEAVAADIWVLTETRASFSPGDRYEAVHCPPHPSRRPDVDERWTSIWSRWPIRPTDRAPDPRGTVSAVIETPAGPVIVYGTVIPWANDKGEDGTSKMWREHYAGIERQAADWAQLRTAHPGVPLIVAGDFNQSRDGSSWYGTKDGRELLSDALLANDLVCVTEEDVTVTGKLTDHHLVDHIAVSNSLAHTGATLSCLPTNDDEGVRLSDHPTVVVDLEQRARS